jgi:hypothetical protein
MTNIEFKSNEEMYFSWWLEELEEAGYIESWTYEPETFVLSTAIKIPWHKQLKTKTKEQSLTLMQPSSYTPDFEIKWNDNAKGVFYMTHSGTYKVRPYIIQTGTRCLVDVKGTFSRMNQISVHTFPDRQKWLYQNTGNFVQKVVPLRKKTGLFVKTFTPRKFLKTPTGKDKKLAWKDVSLDEFLNQFKDNTMNSDGSSI